MDFGSHTSGGVPAIRADDSVCKRAGTDDR